VSNFPSNHGRIRDLGIELIADAGPLRRKLWSTMYLHHHFAIDLAVGTFYATCAFLVASRLKLRPLDAKHAREGLTNGWQRLRWSMQDGDNYPDSSGLDGTSSSNSSNSSLTGSGMGVRHQGSRHGYMALQHSPVPESTEEGDDHHGELSAGEVELVANPRWSEKV
jgi:hypothetical protein